jgi:bifunctional non-homologous end joining protein LigD
MTNPVHVPVGFKRQPFSKGKTQKEMFQCNDRDHLLFYAEMGCLEFDSGLSKLKSIDAPDYLVIAIDSNDPELEKVKDVALATKEILTGLQLPSFVKTDGMSALPYSYSSRC